MSSISVVLHSFSSIFTTVEKITIRWIALFTFRTTGPRKFWETPEKSRRHQKILGDTHGVPLPKKLSPRAELPSASLRDYKGTACPIRKVRSSQNNHSVTVKIQEPSHFRF